MAGMHNSYIHHLLFIHYETLGQIVACNSLPREKNSPYSALNHLFSILTLEMTFLIPQNLLEKLLKCKQKIVLLKHTSSTVLHCFYF